MTAFQTETKITPLATVGDFIKFLQQFPADYNVDFFKQEISYYGSTWDTEVFQIRVNALTGTKSLEITVI